MYTEYRGDLVSVKHSCICNNDVNTKFQAKKRLFFATIIFCLPVLYFVIVLPSVLLIAMC